MRFRLLKLRFRRRLELGEKRAGDISQQAELDLENYLLRRLGRLQQVKRFVVTWTLLLVIGIVGTAGQNYLLSDYYQKMAPVPGGIYNEGILGTFTTANPIYAVSDVDTSVSRLIFAPLFTYNSGNKLVGELASSISVNPLGNVYTVNLKPNLTWQDGQPLTSKDVVFTYDLIENPDAESPLFNSWQGVKITADGPLTVTFSLPDALASFPEDLTNGILPEHLLNTIPASEVRSATFNTENPIGSGPFSWQSISVNGTTPTNAEEQIALLPFNNYVLGKPKLDEFVIHAYADQQDLINAFTKGQLNGAEGLNEVPGSIADMKSAEIHNYILTAGTYAFFNVSSGVLSNQSVRSALVQSVNVPAIMASLGYPTHEVNEPLLEGQLGYNPTYREPAYNLTAAENTLSQAGWNLGPGGIRTNNNVRLSFSLTVSNTPEYLSVANQLKNYWAKLGVNVTLYIEDPNDFNTVLQEHSYQAVLYGISIGNDPDVFVYWDGSQAQANSPTRLNLSGWNNSTANIYLEGGRTSLNPTLRVAEYAKVLAAWQQDLPALGLYQPRLLYITNGPIFGLDGNTVNSYTDRYSNVANWEIDEAKVTT
jgi:peptide/nickel transport system substrate-binding protein